MRSALVYSNESERLALTNRISVYEWGCQHLTAEDRGIMARFPEGLGVSIRESPTRMNSGFSGVKTSAETQKKLRDNWFQIVGYVNDWKAAGIYEWRVAGMGVYVGKATVLRSRMLAYPNNVRRLLQGLHWHGNSKRDYRRIHYALHEAYLKSGGVTFTVLEECPVVMCSERERYWIELRRTEARAGGPMVLNDV